MAGSTGWQQERRQQRRGRSVRVSDHRLRSPGHSCRAPAAAAAAVVASAASAERKGNVRKREKTVSVVISRGECEAAGEERRAVEGKRERERGKRFDHRRRRRQEARGREGRDCRLLPLSCRLLPLSCRPALPLSLSPLFSGSDQGSSLTDEAQTETLQAVLLCMCVRESVSVHGFN